MKYVVVGLSHRTAPLEVRERVSVGQRDLGGALAALRGLKGLEEAVLVSTCNRTEIYASVEEPARDAARLREFLAEQARVPLSDLEAHLYSYLRRDAVRHVFRVASSLDSMVVGESQILGQVKASFGAAQAAEVARSSVVRLMERAFAVAKKVRTRTAIGESGASVASVAVDLAKTIFGDLKGRTVLLVGAGEMGRLTLAHLRAAGVETVYLANRTEERATEVLGDRVEGFFVPLEKLVGAVGRADIVVSTVQAGRFLLEPEPVRLLTGGRRGRPLFLVDIAVPRSLDPELHRLEDVFLYDIDDLQGIVSRNLEARRSEAEKAERLVEEEVEQFLLTLKQQELGPTIKALRERAEAVRRLELERHLGEEVELPPAAREAVDAATRALVNKLVHGPILELKRASGAPNGQITIEVLTRAFLGAPARQGSRDRDEEEGEGGEEA